MLLKRLPVFQFTLPSSRKKKKQEVERISQNTHYQKITINHEALNETEKSVATS